MRFPAQQEPDVTTSLSLCVKYRSDWVHVIASPSGGYPKMYVLIDRYCLESCDISILELMF
jgi:hypothetical protein